MFRTAAVLGPAVFAALLLTSGARASVETETAYTKSQTYSAALRYLRVDLGYEVVEKDPDAAYLLFRFAAQGKKAQANGSIEIVDQRAGERVRVYVRLPELPHFHEQMLSDGLFQKLKNEYGDPPRHDDPPPKDKDKDKDKDSRDGPGDGKNDGKNDRGTEGKPKQD